MIYNGKEKRISKSFSGEIQFHFNSYFGELTEGKYAHLLLGTNNKIILNTSSSDEEFLIFLEGKNDYDFLQSLSNWCFENGITIKEFTKGERTYGGKKLNYSEIQEFKKKVSKRNQ